MQLFAHFYGGSAGVRKVGSVARRDGSVDAHSAPHDVFPLHIHRHAALASNVAYVIRVGRELDLECRCSGECGDGACMQDEKHVPGCGQA